MTSNNEHIYDFMRGERYSVKLVPFEGIESSIGEYPGFYSWYIRPKPDRESEIIPIIHELLQQSTLEATLTGNIRLAYTGTLNKQLNATQPKNLELLRSVFVTIPYPLYIGISINLKKRVGTHLAQLHECMQDKSSTITTSSAPEDSDEESRFFAARISKIFKQAKISSIDCLYLRVHEFKKYGKSSHLNAAQCLQVRRELAEVENIANSIFNPVFGRR